MGSKHSKPPTVSQDLYRALANRAAHNFNTQQSLGLGQAQIAAAVPNPNGKEPLILILRQNDEGKYAFDREHYDRCEELLQRSSSERERERARQRRRKESEGGGGGGEQREDTIPVGRKGDREGNRVYVPAGGREEQDKSGDEGASRRERGRGLDGDRVARREEDKEARRDNSRKGTGVRASKGIAEADKSRQAFVRRKH